MTARCASCCYPLTISDSIVCYECTSYFHIDCAQLVGFPFFELSGDPSRNSFHCATCQLLPLPQHRSDSDSDTEIEGECDVNMPSRQLDYHLDPQGDFAKDMNEIKGSVQDLSELCKDMLREINDLKSINLTLRCCVENLRHDNEERDSAIADLKHRLEALERSRGSDKTKDVESNVLDTNSLRVVKEGSPERYLTPERELEIERPEEMGVNRRKRETNSSDLFIGVPDSTSFRTEEIEKLEAEIEILESKTPMKIEEQHKREKDADNFELSETECSEHEKQEDGINEEDEEKVTFCSIGNKKEEVALETEESRQDWSWKGNKAVELEEIEHENDNADGEEENEGSETENEDAQSWQILDEEIQQNTLSHQTSDDVQESTNDDIWNENKDEEVAFEKDEENKFEEEVEEEEIKERLFALNTNLSESNAEESDWRRSKNEGAYYDEDDIDQLEGEEDAYGTTVTKVEENEKEKGEDENSTLEKEGEEKEAPSREEGEKPPEGLEGSEAVEGGDLLHEGEPRPEGELCLEGEPRLEGEPILDGEPHPEGHQDGDAESGGQSRLEGAPPAEGEIGAEEGQLGGGQSPEDGEVQPPGTPVPQIPQHSEEDLWEYLKETVTSEHPATVEEFVQKLVGTLQHVPQEYLIPVIEANIHRATSPSVTDGEHLPAPEGVTQPEGEVLHTGESEAPVATEGGMVLEGETAAVEGPTPSGESEVPTEGEVLAPEAQEDTAAEGYPVVEAAA